MYYKEAQEIMGRNFFGPDELAKFFGIEMKSEYSNVPHSEELLRKCAETHFLFLLCPFSVNDLKLRSTKEEFPIRIKDILSTKISNGPHPNAFNIIETGWYLVEKNPTTIKIKWGELVGLLSSRHEEIPTACKLFYANLYSLILNDRPMFANIFLRCSDLRTLDRNTISYRGIIKFIDGGFLMDSRDENYPNSVAYVAGKKIRDSSISIR